MARKAVNWKLVQILMLLLLTGVLVMIVSTADRLAMQSDRERGVHHQGERFLDAVNKRRAAARDAKPPNNSSPGPSALLSPERPVLLKGGGDSLEEGELQCASAPRSLRLLQPSTSACGGKGRCNRTLGRCTCNPGYSGYACDIDLSTLLNSADLDKFESKKRRLDLAFEAPSKAGPSDADSNQLLDARSISKLVTVVVPYATGTGGLLHLKQLVRSIQVAYPAVHIIVSVSSGAMVDAVSKVLEGGNAAEGPLSVIDAKAAPGYSGGWNGAVKNIAERSPTGVPPPFILFLAPDVVRFHEHTNLELAVSQMLTTDVDVLGFMTLAPFLGASADGAPKPGKGGQASSNNNEYLLISECWRIKHRQWMMKFDKEPFGYSRHEQFVMYCDRTSNSFLMRRSFAVINAPAAAPPLFDDEMGELAAADFFARIAAFNARLNKAQQCGGGNGRPCAVPSRLPGYVMVGTCSECLLISTVPVDDSAAASTSANTKMMVEFGPFLLPPPINEVLHIGFAEKWQVEAYFPPVGRKQQNPLGQLFAGSSWKESVLATTGHGRLVCVKSGGIYGHSQRGLFAPLCHRYERQRDFAYLASVWTGSTLASAGGGSKKRRYGVSLHHGNLFGALRMGQELFWETDGDIDFISFDDSHEEMMARWDAFLQHVQSNAGFEVKVTYPEKPWYVSLLRDKTDFQVNCRGVKSALTRGKPPQVHNISVWYQGTRCYVNGFQNPWKSIRHDPGHDYRVQYLAQQGWVLNFAKQSIGCNVGPVGVANVTAGAFPHNACLPSCNDPNNVADHNFCSLDAEHDFPDWRDLQPVNFR